MLHRDLTEWRKILNNYLHPRELYFLNSIFTNRRYGTHNILSPIVKTQQQQQQQLSSPSIALTKTTTTQVLSQNSSIHAVFNTMTASIETNHRGATIASNASTDDEKVCVGNTSTSIDKENAPTNSSCEINEFDNRGVHKGTASTTKTTIPSTIPSILSRPRPKLSKEILKQVLRHKLQKLRHLVVQGGISQDYLEEEIFPKLLNEFDPQTVHYNGGVANVKEWKISCYLEVMEGGIPCTNPHQGLLQVFGPLLETCDDLFLLWYKQQHSCNRNKSNTPTKKRRSCKRLMTFVTRYTPAPGEQALLKHIDGAGKVDGSCVVALPTDDEWYGHGGGLTFWDGRERIVDETTGKTRSSPREIHYQTRSGDIAFIDRAVWHQADPITKGTRWALVIFYKVTEEENDDETQKEC